MRRLESRGTRKALDHEHVERSDSNGRGACGGVVCRGSREMKVQKPLPKTEPPPGHGSVCERWVRCGKPGCRCARGELHGPYYALYWRAAGRLRKRCLRRDEAPIVRVACTARRERERKERQEMAAWQGAWRDLAACVKEAERGEQRGEQACNDGGR
jgi:hypothetical protein